MTARTREDFGARSKAEARRTARSVAAKLLRSYLYVGQPYDEAQRDGFPQADADRLAAAVRDLATRLDPKVQPR